MKIKALVVVDDNGVEHTFTSKSLINTETVVETDPIVEEVTPEVTEPVQTVVEPTPAPEVSTDAPVAATE